MKLIKSTIYPIGRRINPDTGKAVNVWRGRDKDGWTHYFYLFRQRRVTLTEAVWSWAKDTK